MDTGMHPVLQRSRRHLLLLATLVGLLTLAAVRLDQLQRPAPPTPLTQLAPDQLQQAEIHSAGGTLRLERRDDGWWLRAPIEAPMDALRSNALLALLTTPRHQNLPYDPARAAEFGLDAPPMSVLLDNRIRIDFGSEAPLEGGRYVRIGDTIHRINRRFFYYLSGPAEGFVQSSGVAAAE